MNLKKINKNLKESIEDYQEIITPILENSFSTIKSGVPVVLYSEKLEDLIQTIAFAVVQKVDGLQDKDYPKALILCKDYEQSLLIKEKIESLLHSSNFRIFITKDQLALDYDKDRLALGVDVLIGTPDRVSKLFSAAGFDGNRLKLFIIHETYELLKTRKETPMDRLSESIAKCQYLYTTTTINQKLEYFVEKTMTDNYQMFDEFEE